MPQGSYFTRRQHQLKCLGTGDSKGIEAIIRSMTPEERSNPVILNGSRRKRIASGSGTSIQEVNRLVKQFDETRRLMKKMSGSGKNMQRMMGGMPGMGR